MYTAHRNLNAKSDLETWSFYDLSIKPKRTQPASALILQNVTIKQPSGKKFLACVDEGKKRSVFTWFRAESLETRKKYQLVTIPEDAARVRFNPRNGDRFFHVDGRRIDAMKTVYLLSTGECFATL
jgi:hypothetical protein